MYGALKGRLLLWTAGGRSQGDLWLMLQNKGEEMEIFTHQLPSVIGCRLLAGCQLSSRPAHGLSRVQ